MARITSIHAEVIEVPLKHLFVTSKDSQARTSSRPVVMTMSLDNGVSVVSEVVPVEYVTGENQETVMSAVEAVGPQLIGLDVVSLQPMRRRLKSMLPLAHTARSGLEIAIWKAHAQATGVPLWTTFGGSVDSIETDITLSITEDVVERAVEAWKRGFRKFKMKIGSPDREGDFQRVLRVHRALDGAELRLDANQAFEADEALEFIGRLVEEDVMPELVEQPVPEHDLEALDYVAENSPVPIFADEAVKNPSDALTIVSHTHVHGINVKLMKSGIFGALDIIAIARAAGIKLMIGCMLETRRGLSPSVALACGTGAFQYVDLDSHLLLDEPESNSEFSTEGPVLTITR